jgi:hypothetical protein
MHLKCMKPSVKRFISTVLLFVAIFEVSRAVSHCAEYEWDKPPWIEEIAYESLIHTIYDPQCGYESPEIVYLNYNTESGGVGYTRVVHDDCVTARYGVRWALWYSVWPVPFTWLNSGSTMTYSRSDMTEPITNPATAPVYTREQCDVIDTIYSGGGFDDWDRVAHTTVKLHPGGKALSSSQRLFSVAIAALEVRNLRWRHTSPGWMADSREISPATISVNGEGLAACRNNRLPPGDWGFTSRRSF